jgi:uncharacterized membrane protein YfcA
MNPIDVSSIVLISITFFAAVVNGALGYGFSSITVPVALIFYTNRILNPALVLIEVVVNIYVLIINRESIPTIWKRVYPILVGLAPGVIIGSYLLSSIQPGWIKFFTYLFLLPLILIQAAGIRRPIRSERALGIPFGAGIGFLYSVTTVSGPPLAVFFNNQGFVKREFRAALGIIRVAESSLTALAYYYLGLYSVESKAILSAIIPSVIVGIPVGAFLIRQMDAETFRRICMSFDVWIVGFGLSRVLIDLDLIGSPFAYSVMLSALLIDGYLLYAFFTQPKRVEIRSQSGEMTPAAMPPVQGISPVESQWNRKE